MVPISLNVRIRWKNGHVDENGRCAEKRDLLRKLFGAIIIRGADVWWWIVRDSVYSAAL